MLNRKLLLVSSGADAPSTIGVAGGQGFGVGVYPGSKAELTAMRLTPISGFDNPSSAHYGNYQHVYLSTMCCVPAFCYRLGQPTAPSYSRDRANALEVKSAFEFPQFEHNKAFVDGDLVSVPLAMLRNLLRVGVV